MRVVKDALPGAPGIGLGAVPLILGCGGFGGVGSDPAQWSRDDVEGCERLLSRGYHLGVRWLDTANSYGDGFSEQVIGGWLAEQGARDRDEIVISTKVGQPTGRHDRSRGRSGLLTRQEVLAEAEGSLARLGTDRIDVYLAHHLDASTSLESLVATMSELIQAGKIRCWGLCNVPAWIVAEAARTSDRLGGHPPAVVQNGYSLLQQGDRREFPALAQWTPLAYTPHSPLAAGWLAGTYQRGPSAYPPESRMAKRPGPYTTLESARTRAQVSELLVLAHQHGVPPSELALAWILNQEFVTAAVIGPANEAELDSAVSATRIRLDAAEVEALSGVFGGLPWTTSFSGVPRP